MNLIPTLSPPNPMAPGPWNPPTLEDIRTLDINNLPCSHDTAEEIDASGDFAIKDRPEYEFLFMEDVPTQTRHKRKAIERFYLADPSICAGQTADGYLLIYRHRPIE